MRGPGMYPPAPSTRAKPQETSDCRIRCTVDLGRSVAVAMSVTRECSASASSTASALSMEPPPVLATPSAYRSASQPASVDRQHVTSDIVRGRRGQEDGG